MRYALIYIIASQLVSLQDVFHLAVQFSKYKSGFRFSRSLKTIQVQEEEQSFACSIDRNFFALLATFVFEHLFVLPTDLRLYRPGVKLNHFWFACSLERR